MSSKLETSVSSPVPQVFASPNGSGLPVASQLCVAMRSFMLDLQQAMLEIDGAKVAAPSGSAP